MSLNNPTIKNQSPEEVLHHIGAETKKAASFMGQIATNKINMVLNDIALSLRQQSQSIIKENTKDIAAAKDKELPAALVDRLMLNQERIEAIARSVEAIAELDDPVGHVLETITRPNGLQIDKISVPIGVLGMIYKSRPNVTVDAAALCLKSHNAVILRGGSESFHSSQILHAIIESVLKAHNLPKAAVSMIPSTDRAYVGAMLKAHDYIDVMIPRGGKGLTSRVMNEARMPVLPIWMEIVTSMFMTALILTSP